MSSICSENTNNVKSEGCCSLTPDNETLFTQKYKHFITGSLETPAGKVPLVTTTLERKDRLGGYKARWGINRNDYKVQPGIYGFGEPNAVSPVYVSANYKMSFDVLRKSLHGLSGWILVIDTKGINVWCAAGKGTFGTAELVRRIQVTGLSKIVFRKKLIVPQLGAVGVSAYEVKRATGFEVSYGPVLAQDIKTYIDNGFQATEEMRTIRFPLKDRLVLSPIQLIQNGKYFLPFVLLFLIAGYFLTSGGVSEKLTELFRITFVFAAIYLAGNLLLPLLLPILPFRSFALKGAVLGLGLSLIFIFITPDLFTKISYSCFSLSIIPFHSLLFTGSSTYTSLSGVRKEMRFTVPIAAVLFVLGIGAYITGKLV